MKNISVTQYAKNKGISRQAVLSKIKRGRELDGIASIEMVGKTYILKMQSGYKNKFGQTLGIVKQQ